jgi:hypothetical protein
MTQFSLDHTHNKTRVFLKHNYDDVTRKPYPYDAEAICSRLAKIHSSFFLDATVGVFLRYISGTPPLLRKKKKKKKKQTKKRKEIYANEDLFLPL